MYHKLYVEDRLPIKIKKLSLLTTLPYKVNKNRTNIIESWFIHKTKVLVMHNNWVGKYIPLLDGAMHLDQNLKSLSFHVHPIADSLAAIWQVIIKKVF